MILIGFDTLLFTDLQKLYSKKICIVNKEEFIQNNNSISKYPINFLEFIKTNKDNYDILYIIYFDEITAFLDAIKLEYNFIYDDKTNISEKVRKSNNAKFILSENFTLDKFMSTYDWYIQSENLTNIQENENNLPNHQVKTLADLVNNDNNLTELDIMDVKILQNKLKMGVLLQAKSMLSRVLKLSNILDKLYDELFNRIENSITTSDTASLMYTTEYISKALSETNQFIVSLVNNEKIQNFFVIDNSTVINTGDTTLDIDKRERIRKAAEIILNNYDNLAEGNFNKVIDPKDAIEIQLDQEIESEN